MGLHRRRPGHRAERDVRRDRDWHRDQLQTPLTGTGHRPTSTGIAVSCNGAAIFSSDPRESQMSEPSETPTPMGDKYLWATCEWLVTTMCSSKTVSPAHGDPDIPPRRRCLRVHDRLDRARALLIGLRGELVAVEYGLSVLQSDGVRVRRHTVPSSRPRWVRRSSAARR
jgi:hypothetical protein